MTDFHTVQKILEGDKMKILHVCGWHEGGGWIAANRMNAALQKSGVESSISPLGITPYHDPQGKNCVADRFRSMIWNALSSSTNCSSRKLGIFGGTDAVDAINASDADIVHLHSPEYIIPIQHLPKITKKIVWYLHDSWTFTGVWQYQNVLENDTRYIDGYSWKNKPKTSHGVDIDKWIWFWKKHCWKELHATFAAPSRWEAECFEKSTLFHGQRCYVIPNCIDASVFHPYDKTECRKEFEFPVDKKLILFGAMDAGSIRKGSKLLPLIIQYMADHFDTRNYHLVVFGPSMENSMMQEFAIPCSFTGRLDSPLKIAHLYSACDVFLCPSLIDNLPNTCVESISCGTPVTAFDVGGICDIVDPGIDGYLAEPYSIQDFAKGIVLCLNDIQSPCISKIKQQRFSEETMAHSLLDLYNKIMCDSRS